jgi:hypothetical protein
VNHVVGVEEKSGHRAIWSNAPDLAGTRARTRRVKGGNGLRRYWDGNCQGDQDVCRRLEFSFCEIEWFYTPQCNDGPENGSFFGEISCSWITVVRCISFEGF